MANLDTRAVWPGWTTVRLIGRGSFGAVYEIERDVLGEKEKAALKVISIPQSDGDIREMVSDGYDEESITSTFREHLKSIVAEYSLMRKLNGSANVVNCDDVRYVQHDDGFGWDIFIKMELLTPLTEALPVSASEEEVVRIARDLCHALVQCRQFDIIHRDIKPQNIFVSPLGDYKLGDFGVAKTVEKTSGGTKIGTYKYMAPEVYNNRPYGAGADIYSLGLVLYWLLNERRLPFLPLPPEKLTTTLEEKARLRRFSGEPIPAPAHGGEELQRIVLKACAYDPKDRYQSAAEMLRDLEALGAAPAAPVPAAPVPAPDASLSDEDESTAGVFRARKIDVRSAPVPAPDASLSDEDESTTGVFRARKIDAGPAPVPAAPAGADAPGGPSADEDATVTARENAAQKPKEVAAKAPPPKKKFPLWIPIVGVLAVAAILLIVLLPKNRSTPDVTPTPTPTPNPVTTPVPTPAPTPWVEDDWTWSLDNGVLTISGTGNTANYSNGETPWFEMRESIQRVVVGDGITGIGAKAFSGCTEIESVELPRSLSTIGDYAFLFCFALKTVEIPENTTMLGEGAFYDCISLESVKIPASVKDIGSKAFYACQRLNSFEVDSGNDYYKTVDGVLFSKDGEKLLYYPAHGERVSYTIPYGTRIVEDGAFYNNLDLQTVKIPASVTTIGEDVFAHGYDLAAIEVDENNAQYKSESGVLFTADGKVLLYYPRFKSGLAYKIPDGVAIIGDDAFQLSDLQSVEIPSSVSSIEAYAFSSCNYLSNVYYKGTAEQWAAVFIDNGNDPLTNAAMHFNSK